MGYYEKDGRLFDEVTHADRGPAKARLDPDRTAVGETKPALSAEMQSVLRTAAASILGPFSIVGLPLWRMAQAMREMPLEFDSARYEKTDLYWSERLAKAKDWLAVYDRGH